MKNGQKVQKSTMMDMLGSFVSVYTLNCAAYWEDSRGIGLLRYHGGFGRVGNWRYFLNSSMLAIFPIVNAMLLAQH